MTVQSWSFFLIANILFTINYTTDAKKKLQIKKIAVSLCHILVGH
jgi:hypothetical protein